MNALKLPVVIAALVSTTSVLAQVPDCSKFLSNPILTKSTIEGSTAAKDRFRLLQCSSSWKSSKDAQAAGIDVTVPVYGIPVSVGGTYDQSKVEQWKSQNCSDEERSADSAIAYFQSSIPLIQLRPKRRWLATKRSSKLKLPPR